MWHQVLQVVLKIKIRDQLTTICTCFNYLEVCEGGKEGGADALHKHNGVTDQGGTKTSLERKENPLSWILTAVKTWVTRWPTIFTLEPHIFAGG